VISCAIRKVVENSKRKIKINFFIHIKHIKIE
jgi:hypothetical protein